MTQTTPGAMFDKVCDYGLIAKGNNETAITKNNRGLRKLDGLRNDIFRSLTSVFMKMFTRSESLFRVSCTFDGL